MRPDNSHMKALEVHWCRHCGGHYYSMRLPDSPDGSDRWLNLPHVPVPADAEPDGRSTCELCKIMWDVANAIDDARAQAAKEVRS
jgi:hypothetical protein